MSSESNVGVPGIWVIRLNRQQITLVNGIWEPCTGRIESIAVLSTQRGVNFQITGFFCNDNMPDEKDEVKAILTGYNGRPRTYTVSADVQTQRLQFVMEKHWNRVGEVVVTITVNGVLAEGSVSFVSYHQSQLLSKTETLDMQIQGNDFTVNRKSTSDSSSNQKFSLTFDTINGKYQIFVLVSL